MTDSRLVAALRDAIERMQSEHHASDDYDWRLKVTMEDMVAAVLPAFLADPRTHEWLEERFVVEGYPEGWILRAFAAAILEGNDHD